MERIYSKYVNNAIKEALVDRDYDSLSAEELLSLCRLFEEVCWFPSSEAEGSASLWKSEKVQDKLEQITSVLRRKCKNEQDMLQFCYLVKSLHILDKVPIKFYDGEVSVDYDGKIVEEALRNPKCDFRILHTMFYVINNGMDTFSEDGDAVEANKENEADQCDYAAADKLLVKSLQLYRDSQNSDGSWTNVSAEEAFARIITVSLYSGMLEDINPTHIVSTAYAHYAQLPCDTPTLLLAKYEANNTKSVYDESGENQEYFFEKAAEMLTSASLSYADRLRLQYIILQTGCFLED